MKNMVKAVLLAGILGTSVSFTVLATPIDISVTGGSSPVHQWGGGFALYGQDFQFEDVIQAPSPSTPNPTINLAGANSIQVTWSAPAGYMYVVKPPPADFQTYFDDTLEFSMWLQFGQAGQAASLGTVTSQSLSMNLVYGNPALSSGVTLENNPILAGAQPAITVSEDTYLSPGSSAFAFTSATMDATFSGTGVSALLSPNDDGATPAAFFAVLFGLPYLEEFSGPSDPGPLFTLEPVPTEGSVPDAGSTLTLAGISFVGLVLCGRKFSKETTA